MPKFRKKPVIVDAVLYDRSEVLDDTPWIASQYYHSKGLIYLRTQEGSMRVSLGDWIIRDVEGEIYSRKPDIFAKTYELVEDYKKKMWGLPRSFDGLQSEAIAFRDTMLDGVDEVHVRAAEVITNLIVKLNFEQSPRANLIDKIKGKS